MIDKGLNYGRQSIRTFLKTVSSPKTLLDLGAGSGNDLLIGKSIHPEATLTGVECYEPNIEKLNKLGIYTVKLNIEKDCLPFENESIDVVMANQILEHCKEIWWITHEVSRVLKVGGSFIVGVPNLASFHNRILLLFGRQPTCIQNNSAHVRGYTKKDFLNFLNGVQEDLYKLQGFKGSNFYPFPPLIAKTLSSILPTHSVGIFFHLVKNTPYKGKFLEYPIKKQLETNFFLG
ncbi:class I SAM-dependent methyltransferase [Chitinophaga niabensis]|uniref:Methionine biosynthesis protein MetW n=1 Tax=Chitinophaga niabensis TaxID=536979 RepID=A0A1N6JXE9_9BACT|nr:class I SAM-dependent methyltransferase [Chitinophaga niabensis]SIO49024.1 Methionine biosynthesis protein MetW [Chitinophaga niabensis]